MMSMHLINEYGPSKLESWCINTDTLETCLLERQYVLNMTRYEVSTHDI